MKKVIYRSISLGESVPLLGEIQRAATALKRTKNSKYQVRLWKSPAHITLKILPVSYNEAKIENGTG